MANVEDMPLDTYKNGGNGTPRRRWYATSLSLSPLYAAAWARLGLRRVNCTPVKQFAPFGRSGLVFRAADNDCVIPSPPHLATMADNGSEPEATNRLRPEKKRGKSGGWVIGARATLAVSASLTE